MTLPTQVTYTGVVLAVFANQLCLPVPAMIFRRARSASRFTVAQLNFGRKSLRDALKRDTKIWPLETMPVQPGRAAAG